MESYHPVDTKLEDLPEDVLCRALSCLGMRDAARVSSSCSAFLRAWGRYPRLTFDEDTLRLRRQHPGPEAAAPHEAGEDNLMPPPIILGQQQQDDVLVALRERDELARGFVRQVDAIMSRRRSDAALDALTIKLAYLREQDAPCVDRWVRLALTSTTTRRLRLDFLPHGCYNPDRLRYDLPCSLLSAGTAAAGALEHLYLRMGSIRAPMPELASLVTLVLSRVRVTGEDLGHLLYSCHRLQSLKLKWCEDLAYLKVPPDRLKQLRILVVKSCWSMREMDISGSSIESLRFEGRHMPGTLLRGSAGPALKVTSAEFDLEHLIGPAESEATESSRLQLLSLAHLMPRLETLSLTLVRHVKVVMTSPHSSGNRFRHLKCVKLEFHMPGRHGRDDFLFLYSFLDSAPTLEALSLDVMRGAPVFDVRRYRRRQQQQQPAGGYFRKHQGLPHHSLKDVDITGFDADLASLELALHILDKARVLRCMSLETIWSRDDDGDSFQIRLIREAVSKYIAPAVPSGSGILLQVK
ncbi:hypothetical protein ACQJBY_024362 [Aegilops geniculata]